MWLCTTSQEKPSFCPCGVAIREMNDLIVMDMCDGQFMKTTLQIYVRSLLPLKEGIEITEANHGKRFTVSIWKLSFRFSFDEDKILIF
jgi:hypothetical protein